MSVPYGAPQQQPSPAQPASGPNLKLILPLAAVGLAVVAYLLAFADGVYSGTDYLLIAGALAALPLLIPTFKSLPVAAVLSVVAALQALQVTVKAPLGSSVMQIIVLILALLQAAAIVFALLLELGVVKMEPKPASPYGQGQPGGWNPQSGAFPQQPGQPGQPAQPGQPQAQPGQPAQQYGAPPSGSFPQQSPAPQQQPNAPQPTSYLSQPGQFGQPGQQPGQPPAGGYGQPQG
ncbi:DUF5336 domain-containing protein [Actinosynnema pretiosum subsp. pretiosum]|uniref:Antigen 34 kDa n=2 Tax=Actinosynnema TaxID=40566 RepID=C6WLS1_ACTMD|nr:DUF5336 domain-containing protein [Actinosynnema mirum]ACU40306.1 hypothetical protein Amir_6506 [Actinosynnema mirum DSM 43827]AXX33818.1 Twin-arginine translocation protein TatA [Actinosynnema pretiosum subsp. pretiosum]QUF02421.1 DUF5336 domain-containing protein [Actinosynnema pretiosum subsp. pretiosum]